MPDGELGEEWIVDALGCNPERLRNEGELRALVRRIVDEATLHPLHEGFWHKFPGAGGVTALVPLRESHLALHTYPERGIATFNLYCCRSGCDWSWEEGLREALGARRLVVRRLERGRDTAGPTTSRWDALPREVQREE